MRAAVRILLAVMLGVVLVLAPLFVVHRVECTRGEQVEDDWTAEVPWDPQPRDTCRNPQSAAEIVLDFVQGG